MTSCWVREPDYLNHKMVHPADSIPVRVTTGRHKGLVVWHTRAEYARLLKNVDRDAARLLGRPR